MNDKIAPPLLYLEMHAPGLSFHRPESIFTNHRHRTASPILKSYSISPPF